MKRAVRPAMPPASGDARRTANLLTRRRGLSRPGSIPRTWTDRWKSPGTLFLSWGEGDVPIRQLLRPKIHSAYSLGCHSIDYFLRPPSLVFVVVRCWFFLVFFGCSWLFLVFFCRCLLLFVIVFSWLFLVVLDLSALLS